MAIYGACSRLVILILLPLVIANQVTPPMIVELYGRRDFYQLEKLLRSIATVAGIPALIDLCFFMFYSEDILALIFGSYYMLGGSVLAILSVGYLFNVACGSCGVVLLMTGGERTMMLMTLLSTVFVLLSSFIAFQFFGILGVACSVSSGMILHNLLMLYAAKKTARVWTCMSPRLRDGLAFLLKT